MFKRSENKHLFKNIGSHLCSRRNKVLSDPCDGTMFFGIVTSRIDEEPIQDDEKMGRPNASIRVLIADELKEGNGWRISCLMSHVSILR